MGAFNIIVVRQPCPVCHRVGEIRCQTHVAEFFGKPGVIESRDYSLEETLAASAEYASGVQKWLSEIKDKRVRECCYADCGLCHAELFVVIDFVGLTPVAAPQMGREEDWPDEFPR